MKSKGIEFFAVLFFFVMLMGGCAVTSENDISNTVTTSNSVQEVGKEKADSSDSNKEDVKEVVVEKTSTTKWLRPGDSILGMTFSGFLDEDTMVAQVGSGSVVMTRYYDVSPGATFELDGYHVEVWEVLPRENRLQLKITEK